MQTKKSYIMCDERGMHKEEKKGLCLSSGSREGVFKGSVRSDISAGWLEKGAYLCIFVPTPSTVLKHIVDP